MSDNSKDSKSPLLLVLDVSSEEDEVNDHYDQRRRHSRMSSKIPTMTSPNNYSHRTRMLIHDFFFRRNRPGWTRHPVLILLFLLTFLTVYHIAFYSSIGFSSFSSSCPPAATISPHQYLQSHDTFDSASKTILMWTKYFEVNLFRYGNGYNVVDSIQCNERCTVTTNRCLLQSSSAVVFHWRDADLHDIPRKRRGQKWILYNQESPENIYTGLTLVLDLFESLFDYVLSYRRDSELHVPYGSVGRLSDKSVLSPGDKTLNANFNFKSKKKMAAWFVSNCHTSSKREDFVRELQKFISVDIYGRCGPFKCDRKSNNCYSMVESDYFFYLSFENSLCKDYVTEKLFNILEYNVIPVVFGGLQSNRTQSVYHDILPPNSFIDALSFNSPGDLAKYLTMVSQNETLYRSFLEWKKTSFLHRSGGAVEEICSVCHSLYGSPDSQYSLNEKSKTLSTSYRQGDWKSWWFKEANCSSWGMSKWR